MVWPSQRGYKKLFQSTALISGSVRETWSIQMRRCVQTPECCSYQTQCWEYYTVGYPMINLRQFTQVLKTSLSTWFLHSAECFLCDPDRTLSFVLCCLFCCSQNMSLFRLLDCSLSLTDVVDECSVKGSLCSGQTDQLCHKHRHYHAITHANQRCFHLLLKKQIV